MITAEQMEKGLFQYFEKEIFSPVGGGDSDRERNHEKQHG